MDHSYPTYLPALTYSAVPSTSASMPAYPDTPRTPPRRTRTVSNKRPLLPTPLDFDDDEPRHSSRRPYNYSTSSLSLSDEYSLASSSSSLLPAAPLFPPRTPVKSSEALAKLSPFDPTSTSSSCSSSGMKRSRANMNLNLFTRSAFAEEATGKASQGGHPSLNSDISCWELSSRHLSAGRSPSQGWISSPELPNSPDSRYSSGDEFGGRRTGLDSSDDDEEMLSPSSAIRRVIGSGSRRISSTRIQVSSSFSSPSSISSMGSSPASPSRYIRPKLERLVLPARKEDQQWAFDHHIRDRDADELGSWSHSPTGLGLAV